MRRVGGWFRGSCTRGRRSLPKKGTLLLGVLRLVRCRLTQFEYFEHVVELSVDVADDVDRSFDVDHVSFFGEHLAEFPADFFEGVFGEGFSLCEGVDDGREVH